MKANRCIPPCAVIPQVSYPEVTEGAAWLSQAFGMQVRMRIANHRVQMRFGNGALIVVERRADDTRRSNTMLRVGDVDACCARAAAVGGKLTGGAETYPYGVRQGHLEHFAGNQCVLFETVGDVDPMEFGFEVGRAFETY